MLKNGKHYLHIMFFVYLFLLHANNNYFRSCTNSLKTYCYGKVFFRFRIDSQ